MYDLIIVGSGPAGLSAAVSGKKTVRFLPGMRRYSWRLRYSVRKHGEEGTEMRYSRRPRPH